MLNPSPSRLQILASVLLASLLPLLFVSWWVYQNTQLPTADAAAFLSNIGDIYHSYLAKGWWASLSTAYEVRAWRPLIFPIFALPGMVMSHGNILIAYHSVAIFSVILTAIYSYLFMRLVLDRIPAIIAANLIGILPLIQEQAITFYAESLLFPCILASLYYLIRSDYFRNLAYSAAFVLMFSLAAMLRPVELVMHLCLVIGVFLVDGFRKAIFTRHQLIWISALTLLSVLIFCLAAGKNAVVFNSPLIVDENMGRRLGLLIRLVTMLTIAVWAIIAIPPVFRESLVLKRRVICGERPTLLIPVVSLSLFLILLWFVPAATETFHWIYRTSFGDVAATTVHTNGSIAMVTEEINKHLGAEGKGLMLTLFVLSLGSLVIAGRRKAKQVLTSKPFLFLLLLTPLTIMEILFTVQDILRKMSVASPALIMAMLLIILWPGRWQRLRIMTVLIVTLLEFSGIWWNTFTVQAIDPRIANIVGVNLSRPITASPNPHNVVYDFIAVQSAKYHLYKITVEVNPYTIEPVDPFLLSAMVNIQKPGFTAGISYFATYDEPAMMAKFQELDAIFLSDSVARMTISPQAATAYKKLYDEETRPILKIIYKLLYHYTKNDLATQGWKVGDCIIIKSACDHRTSDCNGCMLLPEKKQS